MPNNHTSILKKERKQPSCNATTRVSFSFAFEAQTLGLLRGTRVTIPLASRSSLTVVTYQEIDPSDLFELIFLTNRAEDLRDQTAIRAGLTAMFHIAKGNVHVAHP